MLRDLSLFFHGELSNKTYLTNWRETGSNQRDHIKPLRREIQISRKPRRYLLCSFAHIHECLSALGAGIAEPRCTSLHDPLVSEVSVQASKAKIPSDFMPRPRRMYYLSIGPGAHESWRRDLRALGPLLNTDNAFKGCLR